MKHDYVFWCWRWSTSARFVVANLVQLLRAHSQQLSIAPVHSATSVVYGYTAHVFICRSPLSRSSGVTNRRASFVLAAKRATKRNTSTLESVSVIILEYSLTLFLREGIASMPATNHV